MEQRVVTVEFKADVDGERMDVHSATLSLGVNAIPRIELLVAPANEADALPLKPSVIRPSVSYFSDMYTELSEKAESLSSRGNVYITVTAKSDGKKTITDSVSMKGWVLSGVGMSSVKATSAPYLSVILQHPICMLTKVGSIYEVFREDNSNGIYDAVNGANSFLQIVQKVYAWVRAGGKNMFWKSPSDLAPVFRESLGAGDFDPTKYLVEKPSSGLFLEGPIGADSKTRMATAIAKSVLPKEGGSSTWDMLLSMFGALMLSVTQDEKNNFMTDALVLEPSRPWKKASIKLDDRDCYTTDIPGMDPFKLVGVMARKPRVWFQGITLGSVKTGNTNVKDVIADSMYVPSGLTPKKAFGRIMKVQCPDMLTQALMDDAACGVSVSNSGVDFSKSRMYGIDAPLTQYCRALYENTVASMRIGSAEMALWFRDREGSLILPGNTCRFVSGKKDIYYGYINNVVHSLSVSDGCRTLVSMSRVRPGEKLMVDGTSVVQDGDVNAAYARGGKGEAAAGK